MIRLPRHMRAITMIVTAILSVPMLARAVPDAMRVQGTLLTSSGSPANGTYELTFSLWDAASGGAQQWSTTKAGVVVQGGVFEVELTSVPATPFRTLSALWLETRVGTETPLPRQRLDSSAFAFRAGLADEASALLCTGCVSAAHLGTGAVTSVKLGSGAVTTDKLADSSVTADKAAFNFAASATKGGAAANLACSGCVDAAELDQKYAGSATAGGPASDVACADCISAAEVAFPWAASTSEGGPAAGLECTGCVGLGDLDLTALDSRYLRLTGGTLTGNLTTSGTVTATAFAGDGSQLTGLPSGVAPGTCSAGMVVTGVTSGGALICSKLCAVSNFVGSVSDGSTSAGVDLTYQYAPLGTGQGYIKASWPAQTEVIGYQVAVGTSPGATNVKDFVDVPTTSATITGLTLQGAWTGTTYYVTARGVCEGGLPTGSKTSNGVRIAEGATWTGDAAALRTPDSLGGHSVNWPQSGITSVYGEHWFETVNIPSGATVYVQGWGKAQGVTESISSSAAAVQTPKDGWLIVYANTITVDGTITASGRGYGGGGGGGGGSGSVSNRGRGGSNGLGGAGGDGESGSGGGGGGSPGGAGGWGVNGNGGAGNIFGGGSGSTACSGTAGRAGGDGPVGDIGATGGNVPSNAHTGGAGGQGEYVAGGANGVNGCDSRSGGGGGGYGGGDRGGPPATSVQGTVKFFDAAKGYGFITPDDGGKDVFVSARTLGRVGLTTLENNQRVKMLVRMGQKGPMADSVELA